MSNDNVLKFISKHAKEWQLDITTPVLDSAGNALIVGNKYEMYAPAAKAASTEKLGIVWADPVGYSFTFLGVISMGDHHHIATNDISYSADLLPADVYQSAMYIVSLFDACPLCPTWVAAQVIRPATE